MTQAIAPRLMTADDLLKVRDDAHLHELIDGELITMTRPCGEHALLATEFGFLLRSYCKQTGFGAAVVTEAGFLLKRQPDTVRSPDVAVLKPDDAQAARTRKFITVAPTIAIEINSPSDSAGEVSAKVRWWLQHGVRQVWVVDAPSQTITAFFPDGNARVYGDGETLTANHDLPGFTLELRPLFNPA